MQKSLKSELQPSLLEQNLITINSYIILTPTKKEVKKSKLKNNNIVSNKTIKDCKNIEDCDITAIETNLMKAGSDKDFPNISSN